MAAAGPPRLHPGAAGRQRFPPPTPGTRAPSCSSSSCRQPTACDSLVVLQSLDSWESLPLKELEGGATARRNVCDGVLKPQAGDRSGQVSASNDADGAAGGDHPRPL